jgi:peptidoglycan hydrolase CwlO-like protein
MSQSSQQKLLALATVAIIALLGLSAFLIYTKVNQDKLIKKQSAELIEETRVKADLEKEYYQALSDLEEMRGNNSELNAMIETQKAELKKQKDKIDGLIKTQKDLEKAREEIAKLKTYVTEVEELRKKNAALQENNLQLTSQRDELVIAVQQEKLTNEELATSKSALSTERDQLAKDKDALAKKVDIASSIKVSDIQAFGYMVKNSGKESDSKKAKKIDGIKVCFNTTSNVIVSPGQETFFLRIINPLGEVMAIQDIGSGNMKLNSTGESVQYTSSVELEYKPEPVNGCINWQPGIPFDAGSYQVEIYNKGFLAGKASFVLK